MRGEIESPLAYRLVGVCAGIVTSAMVAACGGDEAGEVLWKGANLPLEQSVEGEPSTACIPGEARHCYCTDGTSGSQVCDDSGKRLRPCQCVSHDPAPPVSTGSREGNQKESEQEEVVNVGLERRERGTDMEDEVSSPISQKPETVPATDVGRSKVEEILDHGIDFVTPESAGATRYMQREAMQFVLDPRPGESGRHLDNMLKAAERVGHGD